LLLVPETTLNNYLLLRVHLDWLILELMQININVFFISLLRYTIVYEKQLMNIQFLLIKSYELT